MNRVALNTPDSLTSLCSLSLLLSRRPLFKRRYLSTVETKMTTIKDIKELFPIIDNLQRVQADQQNKIGENEKKIERQEQEKQVQAAELVEVRTELRIVKSQLRSIKVPLDKRETVVRMEDVVLGEFMQSVVRTRIKQQGYAIRHRFDSIKTVPQFCRFAKDNKALIDERHLPYNLDIDTIANVGAFFNRMKEGGNSVAHEGLPRDTKSSKCSKMLLIHLYIFNAHTHMFICILIIGVAQLQLDAENDPNVSANVIDYLESKKEDVVSSIDTKKTEDVFKVLREAVVRGVPQEKYGMLFLYGLPRNENVSCLKSKLREAFSMAGSVTAVHLNHTQKGLFNGTGWIAFFELETVDIAHATLPLIEAKLGISGLGLDDFHHAAAGFGVPIKQSPPRHNGGDRSVLSPLENTV